jgi:hypothetical protein
VDPHKRLMKLMAGLSRQYMEIGSLLEHIRDYRVWSNKKYKCSSFRQYLALYPGLGYSTAQRWMLIARTFGALRYPRDLTLGPTKMFLLCPLVDQSNVKQMLVWAAKSKSSDILRRRKARRNRTVSFWVTDEEAQRIETYVDEAVMAGEGEDLRVTRGDAAVLLFDTAMHQMVA